MTLKLVLRREENISFKVIYVQERRTLVLRREENISSKVIYVQERRTLVLSSSMNKRGEH
jgi:hypothetical protein